MKQSNHIIILIFLLSLTLTTKSQSFEGRFIYGENEARKELSLALQDTFKIYKYKITPSLLKDKETAISVAEPILFKVYGKKNIIRERPYESYLIDNYWVIFGTMLEGNDGGTFLIILDARNSKIIKIIHGQ